MSYLYTTTRELARAFRADHKDLLDFRIIGDGMQRTYTTDTRLFFIDWVESLRIDGHISDRLAYNAHLSPSKKLTTSKIVV